MIDRYFVGSWIRFIGLCGVLVLNSSVLFGFS